MAAHTKDMLVSSLNGKSRYLICFADADGNLCYVKDISSIDEYPFTHEFEEAARFDELEVKLFHTVLDFAYPERTFELMKITIAVEFC